MSSAELNDDQPPFIPDTNTQDALKKLSEELSVYSDFSSQSKSTQFKITPPAGCPSSPKAAVTLDNIGDWFVQNAKIYDRDGDKALNTAEMRYGLKNRCIPFRDAESLKFILNNKEFFADVDQDFGGDQKRLDAFKAKTSGPLAEQPVFVSDKDMLTYAEWRTIARDDMQKLKALDLDAYNGITFLKKNFATLDADKNGGIMPKELRGAIDSGRFSGKDLQTAESIATNFQQITEKANPRGWRTQLVDTIFGWEQSIYQGTIASYVMKRNDEFDTLGESFNKAFGIVNRSNALEYYDYPKLPGATEVPKPQGSW